MTGLDSYVRDVITCCVVRCGCQVTLAPVLPALAEKLQVQEYQLPSFQFQEASNKSLCKGRYPKSQLSGIYSPI